MQKLQAKIKIKNIFNEFFLILMKDWYFLAVLYKKYSADSYSGMRADLFFNKEVK